MLFAVIVSLGTAAQASDESWEPMFLAVNVNTIDVTDFAVIYISSEGMYAASPMDLEEWRFLPPSSTIEIEGEEYVELGYYDGLVHTLDTSTLTLKIRAPPATFAPH